MKFVVALSSDEPSAYVSGTLTAYELGCRNLSCDGMVLSASGNWFSTNLIFGSTDFIVSSNLLFFLLDLA